MSSGKLNLNNHLKNGEIDLSLSEIKEVPVKELAQYKSKASSIDLSNNKISNIGKNFPVSLTHIVKLNLSKNLLKSLPDNFGELINLKHLDLYNNKIQTLPLSFGNLKKLEWLDVKGNPLAPKVAQITGPCSNKKECEAAAKNTVKIYAAMLKDVENEKKALLAQQKKKEKEDKAAAQNKQEDKSSKKNKNKENNKSSANTNLAPSPKTEKSKQKSQPQQNGKQQQTQKSKQKNSKNDKKDQAKPKSFLGKVFGFISSLFKIIFVSTIVSVGAIFVLSLLDEDKFKILMEHIRVGSQNYVSRDLQNSIIK
ncbi:leucine-rich repeat-containing protein 59 [Diaphorina citri]|uniref:Leucine-rich repeat-containing protein 59 n=1 Tax=Diaphorina citri TaxID=121845 RepID=A0A3Q0ILI9_DIACI|nr:leucine-rich repeat-containing protein 59 [Diaphorina citri]